MTTLHDDQILGEFTAWAQRRGRVAAPHLLAAVLAARCSPRGSWGWPPGPGAASAG